MKILHVSDLHSRETWFLWLIAESPCYDLVCVAGDILDLGDLSSVVDEEIDAALSWLADIRTPLALCSGNHDIHYHAGHDGAQWMRRLRRKNVWLDGDTFRFHGYRFRCIGWCDPVPRGTTDDFWLMHAPPFSAKTSTVSGGCSHGDEEARDAFLAGDGPKWALGGHVHRPLEFVGAVRTTITLNPGRGDSPHCPSHFVIDMKERTLIHNQAMLSGTVVKQFKFIP